MLETLKKNRSIRKYKNEPISEEQVEKLVKAALMSPSSRNIKPWEFIVVKTPDMLQKLSLCKTHGSKFLEGAALGIVVTADSDKSDVWIEDASIAALILQLTAESMHLGSCWIQIRNRHHDENQTSEQYVKNLLDIPDPYRVEAIIAIGHPDETRPPLDEKDLLYSKVHYEKFNDPNCRKNA